MSESTCKFCRVPHGARIRRVTTAPWCWIVVGSSLERRFGNHRLTRPHRAKVSDALCERCRKLSTPRAKSTRFVAPNPEQLTLEIAA